MTDLWRIAAVQMNCDIGRKADNLQRIVDYLESAARAESRLVIFPECSLTGYCFESRDEAWSFGESIPGPAVDELARACYDRDMYVVVGLLERAREHMYNSCVLVGPMGLIGSYRKIHLPFLGVDRFTTPGDRPFRVWDIDGLRLGLNICYDGSFPESARTMALDGADLIALPTNWPPGSECASQHMIATRAMENTIYYAAVNRVGVERGFAFIGGSRICDPTGNTLAAAEGVDETMLIAEIDVTKARNKRLVRVPGKHEINRIADRRPELYSRLTEPMARDR
jgi:predicted amidohydrolase